MVKIFGEEIKIYPGRKNRLTAVMSCGDTQIIQL